MSEVSLTPRNSATTAGFEIPVRLLSIAAGVVLLAILGAAALSIGVWLNEGQPTVVASFGGPGGRGPVPGGARPGAGTPQQQGGQPGGGFQPGRGGAGQPQGQRGGVVPGGQQPNPAPQGQRGAQPGAGARIPGLSGTPDLTGVVTRLSDGTLTLQQARQGSTQVLVTSATRIFRRDGSAGSSSDLTAGATVAIVTVAGASTPTAAELAILTPGR